MPDWEFTIRVADITETEAEELYATLAAEAAGLFGFESVADGAVRELAAEEDA